MARDEFLVEFHNITKTYKDLKAVDDLSFGIRKGEIFGFIGPNGAGKTTTIKILVGLIPEFSGEVLINGENISNNSNLLYKSLGYLPQDCGFQEWRTVDQLLSTFGKLSGVPDDRLNERIESALKIVELSDVRKKKIVHLSGGMQQKLRLAQALLHEPKLIVLDEPMNGLDPTSRYLIKQVIRDLAKMGITIFFSSHILSDVQDIADRIAIINKGKMLKIGTPSGLQKEYQIGNNIEYEIAENTQKCSNLDQLSCVKTIETVSNLKDILHLKSEFDVDASIRDILQKLLEQKCHVRTLNLIRPNLEDVYLQLVRGVESRGVEN
jgi:ABC-2 type transport system ATP-binding protein